MRRLVGELLYEVFGDRRALGRGYMLHEPAYRSLVWDRDLLVATGNGCLLECEPPIRLYGNADGAVREGWRGRGIVRTMHEHTLSQAEARGVYAMVATTANLGAMLISNGYEPVRPGELLVVDGDKRRFVSAGWYLRWFQEPIVPLILTGRF